MLENQLQDLGFKYNESKLYIKLLSIGPQPASVLAQTSGLNRTSTYMILKNLQNKGFISSYNKDKLQIYSANDPTVLISHIDQKRKTFNYQRQKLVQAIPEFRSLTNNYDYHKPVVNYHHGSKGISNLTELIKESQAPIYAYHNFEKWKQYGDIAKIINDYAKLKQNIYIITPTNNYLPEKQFPNINISNYNQHKHPALTFQDLIILNDKIIYLNISKNNPYGISVQNDNTTNFQRAIFEITWEKFQKSPIV